MDSFRSLRTELTSQLCFVLAFFAMSFSCVGSIAAQESGASLSASLPTKEQRSTAATFKISLSPTKGDPSIERLAVEAKIADGWHIYPTDNAGLNIPTEIKFEPTGLDAIDEAFKLNGTAEDSETLVGQFNWHRDYRITDKEKPFSGSGSIRFQACDESRCLPPNTLTFRLNSTSAEHSSGDAETTAGDSDVIKLETEECRLTRPAAKFDVSMIFTGGKDDQIHRKCSIEVEGKSINIYLPKEETYTIENSAENNTNVSNTSTYISIDQNSDGILDDHEARPTNLPIRILDSMYRVVSIAEDASSISLVKSDGPLFGTVLNRKCPEFSFQTLDGSQTISDKSILGKVTMLDIWAVT